MSPQYSKFSRDKSPAPEFMNSESLSNDVPVQRELDQHGILPSTILINPDRVVNVYCNSRALGSKISNAIIERLIEALC